MSNVRVTKKDIIWSYIAQFFNLGAGLITLPLVLHMLSEDEIGMNYLMLTVSSMVALLDFGFAPQFARNITYVFSGAPELRKEGIAESTGKIDYTLLANMIKVAKKVYAIMAVLTLILMLTGGTAYIYKVTDGFTNVKHSLIIWIIYSVSVFFNIYYVYYSSLLTGRGQIMESKKAMIAQRLTYICLTFALLLSGMGLLGVVIANLLAPFVGRILSYRMFYDNEMKNHLANSQPSSAEQKKLFLIIWYNAKKLGIVFLGSYAINKIGMFFAGLYLNLAEIASYGLMIQLVTIISQLALTFNISEQPLFNAYRTEGRKKELLEKFALTMNVYYIIFIVSSIALLVIGPWALRLIGSNAVLPACLIVAIYCFVVLLEGNHGSFATFIVTENKIPFVESSLIAGAAICIGSFFSLKFTTLGILGLVLVQGISQLVYANWKWPYVVCRDFHISFPTFLSIGFKQSLKLIPINHGR